MSQDKFTDYRSPNELSLGVQELHDYTSFISGKVKTLIDAVIDDPQRRKAIKDLIHNAIWSESYTPGRSWAEQRAATNVQGTLKRPNDLPFFPFSHGERLKQSGNGEI